MLGSAGRCRRLDRARVRGLVDPSNDRAAHVVDQVAALAAADLLGDEAAGDELVAEARTRRPANLAFEQVIGVKSCLLPL